MISASDFPMQLRLLRYAAGKRKFRITNNSHHRLFTQSY